MSSQATWATCPLCGRPTKLKLRPDTRIENFLFFCPKCKQEVLIDAEGTRITRSKAMTRRSA